MTTFSVFNWDSGKYDYYTAPGGDGVAPQPRKQLPRSTTKIGVAPEDILRRLPDNAQRAGSGVEPVGVVAVSGDDAGTDLSLLTVGMLLGSAYLLWKVF